MSLADMDISAMIAKLLGFAIILGSFTLKVPQIIKIVKNKSVVGLSFPMFALELFGFIFQGSYAVRKAFPLDAYAEVLVIMVQNFIIVFLLFKYGGGINGTAVLMLSGAVALLAWELTTAPLELVASLQATTVAIFSASKVPQIYSAFRAKSTGQLDLFMVALQTGGSLARVFTTFKTVDDPLYLLSYVIGTTLNAVMLVQVLVYGNAEEKGGKQATRKSPRKTKKVE